MKKARKPRPQATLEGEVLNVLEQELASWKPEEAEGRIRRRLKRKKLGPYEPEQVAELRRFRNELLQEIGLGEKSRFFVGRHGHYVEMEDFDVPRLAKETAARFPSIPREVVESFTRFSVFVYYQL